MSFLKLKTFLLMKPEHGENTIKIDNACLTM